MMGKYITIIVIILLLVISLPFNGRAQREQVFVGTRPLSMGEAFVALADDGNAIYWNPAGLARMERVQASFNYSDLYGVGIKSYYASFISRLYFVPKLADYFTFGVDWFGVKTGDDEFDFSRNQFNFSLGFKPSWKMPILRDVDFGLNVKHVNLGANLNDRREADASGYGWDFGVLYNMGALPLLPRGLNFGLMAHDVSGTHITHETGVREEILPQNIRWGFSYRPFQGSYENKSLFSDPVFALDFDDRVHLGLEFWLLNSLALRAGIQKDLHTDEPITLSFGAGIRVASKTWELSQIAGDYGLVHPPVLPEQNAGGLSFVFHDNPRLIRIEEAFINPVFASLYHYYEKKDSKFGLIKLKNLHDEPLVVTISFKADKYAYEQPLDTLELPAGQTVAYDLNALFKSDILNARENRIPAEITATYEYNEKEYRTSYKSSLSIFNKNFITWDDPARAAAFITPTDATVLKFSQQVNRMTASDNYFWINDKVSMAVKLFESLSAYGFHYTLDPNTPFTQIQKNEYQLDRVQYPVEIISDSRQGDCDDLSVLYASLLESAGIATALISIKGHLFMMFNTGVLENQDYRFLDVDNSKLDFMNGTVWLPIETTWVDSSFYQAWQEGARRYNDAKNDSLSQLEVILVNENWTKYAPTSPDREPPAQFDFPDLTAKVDQSFALIESQNEQFLDENYFSIIEKDPTNYILQNRLGILYAQNGFLQESKQQFHQLIETLHRQKLPYWQILNNLANVYFMLAIADPAYADSAEIFYTTARESNNQAAGPSLNLALYYSWRKNLYPKQSEINNKFELAADAVLQQVGAWLNKDSDYALELIDLPDEIYEQSQELKAGRAKETVKKIVHEFKKKFYTVFKPKRKQAKVRHAGTKAGILDQDVELATILWWGK